MSKRTAHFILLFFDICCIWGLYVGGNEVQRILSEIHNLAEVIDYVNRVCFFLVGMVVPIIHFLSIIEYFRPNLVHKHILLMNLGVAALVVGLFSGSIFGSFYLTYRLKSAGYVYCRQASGISALAKSVVYTINTDVCEEVAATHRRRF